MNTKALTGILNGVWRKVIAAAVTLGVSSVVLAANWNDSVNRETAWPNNGNVSGDVYTVNNARELAQFAWTVNQGNNYLGKTVMLAADINLGGNLWTPAGTVFCGTFDGDGRAISSMTIDMASTSSGELNAGFFSVIEKGSVIRNVRFTDVNIWCAKNGMNVVRVGAVAGVAWKALIENCVVDGNIGDKDSYPGQNAIAGGIVGDHMQGGVIRNCVNHATIWVEATGNGLALGGGIAGVLMESRIENCLNTGQVWGLAAGTLEVGGLVGRVDTRNGITVETWIENCLNTGIVKCSTAGPAPARLFVGALVGDCNHSTVAVVNSYWTTDIEPLGGGAVTGNTVIKATGTPGTLESTHPTLDVDDLEFALVYWATLQNDVTPDRFVTWSALGTSDGYPAPVQGTAASVTYPVTLDHNDGQNTVQNVFATFGQAMPEAEMPVLKDHTFLGFFDSLGQWAIPYYTDNMLSARPWDKTSGATLYAQWEKDPEVEKPVPEIGDKNLTGVQITAIDVVPDYLVTLTWKRVKNAEAYFMYGKRTLDDILWDGILVRNPLAVPDNKLMADFVMDDDTQGEYHFFAMRAKQGPPPPSVPGPDGIDGTEDDLTIESATSEDVDKDTGYVTVPEGGSEITVGGEPLVIEGVTGEDGKFPPGTIVFPDGTIIVPGDNGNPPTINPDGTVNVEDGDKIIYPPYDEVYIVGEPGGVYDPSYPGIVIGEDPKTVILIPDGTVIIDNGDGTTSIVLPGPDGEYFTGDDLTVSPASPADVDKDTGYVTVPEGGSEITVGGEPLVIEDVTDEDGKFPPGTIVFPDGTIIVPGDNGNPPTINPDGTVNVEDGDKIIYPPYDEVYIVGEPGGVYDPSYPGIVISEDPKVVVLIPDGTVIVDNGDGTVSIVLPGPDGEYFTGDDLTVSPASPADVDKDTGYVTVPEGGSEITVGGEPIIIDGVTDEDGKFPQGTVVFPDGTIIVPGDNGNPPTINPDGTVNVEDGDKIIYPPYDEVYIVGEPGGIYDPSYPGIVISEDPKVVVLIPDGTVIIDNGDGTVSIILPGPDGEYFTGDDLTVSPASPADVDKDTGYVTVPEGGSEITVGGEPLVIEDVTGEDGKFPQGTIVFPDGTIIVPGDGGNLPTINPDGTVNVEDGDKIIYPPYDEVYIVGEPGGVYDPSYPGIVISEDPKVVVLIPDGTVIIDNGDGTVSIVLPGPDGEYLTGDDLTIGAATPEDVDAETGYVTVPEGGSEITVGDKPLVIEGVTGEDGKFPQGTVVFPDGTIIVPGDNGNPPTINPDGTVNVEGGDKIIYPPYDEVYIVGEPGGVYDPSYPGIVISEDPKVVILIPDGTVIVDNGDGTVSIVLPGPDGEYFTGDDLTVSPASPADVDKDTGYVTVPEGGSEITVGGEPLVIEGVTDEDGKFPPGTIVFPDGTIIVPGDGGNLPTINPDGTVNVDEGDKIIYPPYDEVYIVGEPGGVYDPSYPGIVISEDPKVVVLIPDGTVIIDNGDGTVSIVLPGPDGEYLTGDDLTIGAATPEDVDAETGYVTVPEGGSEITVGGEPLVIEGVTGEDGKFPEGTIVFPDGTIIVPGPEADGTPAINEGGSVTVGEGDIIILPPYDSPFTVPAPGGTYNPNGPDGPELVLDTEPETAIPLPLVTVDVTFEANGGTEPEQAGKTVTVGFAYGALPGSTRDDGFTFAGWFTDPLGGDWVSANTKVVNRQSHALWAQWTAVPLGGAFLDGGFFGNAIRGELAEFPIPAATAGGAGIAYELDSGTLPPGLSVGINEQGEYVITGTVAENAALGEYAFVLKATPGNGALAVTAAFSIIVAAPPPVTVSFDANGGNAPDFASKLVIIGEAYGALPGVTRDGPVDFSGWHTDTGTLIETDTIVSLRANHTLWAKWVPTPVGGAFLNGGLVGVYTRGDPLVPMPLPKAEAGGAGITYEYVSGSSAVIVFNGNNNGVATVRPSINDLNAGNYTFYVLARPDNGADPVTVTFYFKVVEPTQNTVSVTFNANGGDTPDPVFKTYTVGAPYGAFATVTRTGGYTFDGWFTQQAGGTQVTTYTEADANVTTLWAHWAPVPVGGAFLNGGNICVVTQGQANVSVTVPEATIGGAGIAYALDGTLPDGLSFNADTRVISGTVSTATAPGVYTFTVTATPENGATPVTTTFSITVHAMQMTVTLDPNGGDTPTPDTLTVKNGKQYGMLPTATRAGYTFQGWFTAANGGTLVTSTTIVAQTADHTLWAQWKPPTPAETAIGGTVTIDGIEWVKVREIGKGGQPGDEFALLMLKDVMGNNTYPYADSGYNGEYLGAPIQTDVNAWYNGLNAPTLKAMAWSCLMGTSPGKSWPSSVQDNGNCFAFIPRLADISNLTNDQRAIGKAYWTSTKAKFEDVVVGYQRYISPDGEYYDVSSVVGMKLTDSMSTYVRPVLWIKQK